MNSNSDPKKEKIDPNRPKNRMILTYFSIKVLLSVQGFIQAPNNLHLADFKAQSKFQFSNWIFF